MRIFLSSGNPVCLEHISLFPVDTYKGRKNGLRKDLAQALEDMHPGVFRFPGGCIVEGTTLDTRYLENGSYFRLASMTLGYTFDSFDNWIQSLQLYATCNNVFTITSYKGLDPEVNLGGIDPGIDYRWSNYPHTRTIMVGAKINF